MVRRRGLQEMRWVVNTWAGHLPMEHEENSISCPPQLKLIARPA